MCVIFMKCIFDGWAKSTSDNITLRLAKNMVDWLRYMAPAPPPYDPYAGYPVAPVPMPAPAPVAAPSSYVPVQVILSPILVHFTTFFYL